MFAQISTQSLSAREFLTESRFSLLTQSDWDKKHLQKDGWGIGEWQIANSEWRIVKSEKPVFVEKEKFKKVAKSAKSKIILAHIRHASNPRKLPRKELIRRDSCQPFIYKNLVFAHNGTLNIPDAVAETLGNYKERICGTNDSEVLFWLFVKCWQQFPSPLRGEWRNEERVSEANGSPPLKGWVSSEGEGEGEDEKRWKTVFQKMIAQIDSVWNAFPKRKRKFSIPFRGLNCIASDGKSLAALCFYEKAEGRSLCGQNRPYFEMCYNILPEPFTMADRVVVASEPMDHSKNWKPIPNRHLLLVNRKLNTTLLSLSPGGRGVAGRRKGEPYAGRIFV